ncbi:MAG: glycoside hydrolase family 3 N-terminal domain-containing protein, partial [bacterium]|nr:glycoside hydrolase family 3 N-terminal domain-containing protein [bacterium]
MRDLGGFIISGFNGTEFNRELERKILIEKVGGLIFFSRNIKSLSQIKTLIKNCREARASVSETPLITAIDYEGSPVNRFGFWADEIPS